LARGCAAYLASDEPDLELPITQIAAVRDRLWQRYRSEVQADATRIAEHRTRTLQFDGATMRYSMTTVGDAPERGHALYIALHGGGGAPAQVNDEQWQQMQRYYLASISAGLYVAPRGVADTWDLHFTPKSFPLYERLIENLLAFEKVDPDRVYLLGYSAGGDGVFALATRVADRWAAASMSAGHPNQITGENLCNLPLLMQVGERDTSYNRHLAVARFAQKLVDLSKRYPGHYQHQLHVHIGRGHGILDNHPQRPEQFVFADVEAWIQRGDRRGIARNTNSIAWLERYHREPLPERIVWDPQTSVDRTAVAADGTRLWPTVRARGAYWLQALGTSLPENAVIEAQCRHGRLTVSAGLPLRLLLTQRLVDLGQPIEVAVTGGETQSCVVKPTLRWMVRSLLERGDPRLMFEAALDVVPAQGGAGWQLRPAAPK
jgi:poly(3-hydroxybutyrate) depolymerase